MCKFCGRLTGGLVCGFGEKDGKRVWHDWTNKEKDVA